MCLNSLDTVKTVELWFFSKMLILGVLLHISPLWWHCALVHIVKSRIHVTLIRAKMGSLALLKEMTVIVAIVGSRIKEPIANTSITAIIIVSWVGWVEGTVRANMDFAGIQKIRMITTANVTTRPTVMTASSQTDVTQAHARTEEVAA